MQATDSSIEWSGTNRLTVGICERFIRGVAAGPPYSALFDRLIRVLVVGLWRCGEEPHGSSTVSAGVDQAKPFQMKQIVA